MHAILISAFNTILAWGFRAVVIKFVVFTGLLLITTELTSAVLEQIGTTAVDGVETQLSGVSDAVKYFFGLFRLDLGLPMLLSAQGTAFAIRRLPVIG